MKGFWSDAEGITVVEILGIVLGIGTLAAYWKFGSVDTNFADIAIAAIIGVAGQKIGVTYSRSRYGPTTPSNDDSPL